jgi:RNA polymerase sigma factor (sigma-70 family)
MAEIEEMARLEYNCEQREYRRKLKAKEVGICNNNSNTDPVLTEIVRREQNKATANAFNELLPEQQELIRLIHLQDVKAREIAKRDNVSDSAISKRLQRAENNLKKLLA